MNKLILHIKITLTLISMLVSLNLHASTYIGGKLGKTNTTVSCALNSPCNNNNLAGSVLFGYKYNTYFSTEYSADILGRYETSSNIDDSIISDSGNLRSLTFTPKMSLPITNRLDLFTKIGAAFMVADNASDLVPTISGGAEYKLMNNISLTAEYQYYKDMSDENIHNLDTSYFALGVIYHIGKGSQFDTEVTPAQATFSSEEQLALIEKTEHDLESKTPQIRYLVHPERSATLYFDSNQSVPNDREPQMMVSLVAILKSYPESIMQVTGYSDNTGKAIYNEKLSNRRAQTVANMLINHGIDASRLIIKGKGENNAVSHNNDETGRSKNRRVELVIPSFNYIQ